MSDHLNPNMINSINIYLLLVAFSCLWILSLCQEDITIELNLGYIQSIEEVWISDTKVRLFNSTNRDLCVKSVVDSDDQEPSNFVITCVVKNYVPYVEGKPTELFAELFSQESGHIYASFDVSYTAEKVESSNSYDSETALPWFAPMLRSRQAFVGGATLAAAGVLAYKLDIIGLRQSVLYRFGGKAGLNMGNSEQLANGFKRKINPFGTLFKDLQRTSEDVSYKALNCIKWCISRPHRLSLPTDINKFLSFGHRMVNNRNIAGLKAIMPLLDGVVQRGLHLPVRINQSLAMKLRSFSIGSNRTEVLLSSIES